MPDQGKPVARPWQRYLRFSIRGLIVLVLVIGAGLGWLVRSARIQRDAVAAIKNAGGIVYYDYAWEGTYGNLGLPRKPWAPRWLVAVIGVDYFGQVTDVAFINDDSTATDTVIAQVGRLTRLQRLSLYGSGISDAWLEHISGLTNLTELDLARTQVTDVWLSHLKALSNLSNLNLSSTRVTDAGLAHLNALPSLTSLDLQGTHITDAGLAHLKGLTHVSVLSLNLDHITDAGLVHLKALTNLHWLHLHGNQVTDAGVKELEQALPSLKITR
jgi:Leucine-rich repeat (LRR) protein